MVGNLLSKCVLSHPLFVHFECTYRCNMVCSFCNIWRRNLFPIEASTSEFKRRLLDCWDLGCVVVSFTGGEPLLRGDIKELLNFSSHEVGFYTGLLTNGLLLGKRLNDIVKNVDFLAVSFDVNDEKMFNATRGAETYMIVKKNIEKAKSAGVDINLFSVLTKANLELIDSVIEFAEDLDVSIHFSPVGSVPRELLETSDATSLRLTDVESVLETLNVKKKKYSRIHFEPDYFHLHANGGFNRVMRCASASTTISLKPDASVSLPCPFLTLHSVDKGTPLQGALKTDIVRDLVRNCGGWSSCANCSINCMYVVSLPKYPYHAVRWIANKT